MAGSGDFSRIGWIHALNSCHGVANGVTGSTAINTGPPGDLIGNLSATFNGSAQTTVNCAASGGGAVLTKAIPDGAIIAICDAAGTVDTQEYFCVNGAAASAATSITVDSVTTRVSHAAGSPIYLVSFQPYIALTSTAPTSHALGTEVTFTSYTRQLPVWTPTTVADPPVAANSGTITFGPFTGGTGATVTGGMEMDALSGGTADNMYAFYAWGTSKTPGTGDSLQITSAQLSLAGS